MTALLSMNFRPSLPWSALTLDANEHSPSHSAVSSRSSWRIGGSGASFELHTGIIGIRVRQVASRTIVESRKFAASALVRRTIHCYSGCISRIHRVLVGVVFELRLRHIMHVVGNAVFSRHQF